MSIIRIFSPIKLCVRMLLLSVFSLPVVSAQHHDVSAEHQEDAQAALDLYNQVEQVLEQKLNRPDAPATYRNSYALFKAKEFVIKNQLSETPMKAADILHSNLSVAGLSHLRFKKLKKGSLGIEMSKYNKKQVGKVYSNSPAEKCGIRDGDYLEQIADKPIAEADLSSLLEDSAYSNTTVVVEKNREIQCLCPVNLGIKVEVIIDGRLLVTSVGTINSGRFQVGDLISTINGVAPSQEDVVSINEDREFINPCIIIKGRLIPLKAIPEENFKQGSFGFCTKANQDNQYTITRVFPDSSAAQLGLKKGDSILAVDDALCNTIKLKSPGEEVTIHVKKSNGLESLLKFTVSSGTVRDQTYFREIDHQGKKAIYVRIADFDEKYYPQIVHEALNAAKNQFIIIDLRGNRGGRCEHVLGYFLKPEALIVSFVGYQGYEKREAKLSDFLHGQACWDSRVKEASFPFYGRVAFLVDEDTCCAAEMCVLAPIEYQSLRKKKEISGIKYNGELYPKKIIVIGKSGGKAQWLREKRLTNRLGQFVLDYPGADLYTYINNQSIEGNGIDGIPVRNRLDSDGMDPEIIQAIEWNEKEKSKPVKYETCDF